MKKIFALLTTILLIHFSFAQFSFNVFPTSVYGDPYADTLLNTRAVLSKLGIRQVNAYHTSSAVTKTFASKSVNLNTNGSIDKLKICFAKNKSTNFTFCVEDTFTYDKSGRLVESKKTDNYPNKYPLFKTTYVGNNEIRLIDDSSTTYQYFNEKGQMVKIVSELKGQQVENTLFYYNQDGLLDSTRNVYWGTFIFKRTKKAKNKLITMENSHFKYKWIYNSFGQCVSSMIIMKDRPNVIRESGYKGDLKTETHYFYNADGTLSKVITQSDDKPTFEMLYSYSK